MKREDVDFTRAYEMAYGGMTNAQIADALGVSEGSFYKEKLNNEEIAELIKRGRADGIARAVGMLQSHIIEGDKTSLIFFLKCKGGFSENQGIIDKIARELAELKGETTE